MKMLRPYQPEHCFSASPYFCDMITGLIADPFLPFHRGHQALIEKARLLCQRLTVFVCSGPADPIPGWIRYAWVKNTFPALDVRHLMAAKPPDAAQLNLIHPSWLAHIRRNIPAGTTALIAASESDHDSALALALGLPLQAIGSAATAWPEHPETILHHPGHYWEALPAETRPYFIRRVALVGPESCGKSVLAEKLAAQFQTVFVEEYGRAYCEKFGMDLSELDFAHIAGGQLYREDTCAKHANRVLFCDTELIVTQVWSEIFLDGTCQPWIFWANHLRRYDLFLLLAPDIPWVNDGLREFENQRSWMFERLQAELEARSLPYVTIRGDFDTRTAAAISAVEHLLTSGE